MNLKIEENMWMEIIGLLETITRNRIHEKLSEFGERKKLPISIGRYSLIFRYCEFYGSIYSHAISINLCKSAFT
jgi:hypothetical protein